MIGKKIHIAYWIFSCQCCMSVCCIMPCVMLVNKIRQRCDVLVCSALGDHLVASFTVVKSAARQITPVCSIWCPNCGARPQIVFALACSHFKHTSVTCPRALSAKVWLCSLKRGWCSLLAQQRHFIPCGFSNGVNVFWVSSLWFE